MADKSIEENKVYRIDGAFPALSLASPEEHKGVRKSSRVKVLTEKGAGYKMQRVIEEEKKIHSAWRKSVDELAAIQKLGQALTETQCQQ